MSAAERLAPTVGVVAACEALNVSRATLYRRREPRVLERKPRHSHRRIPDNERVGILDLLHSPRFVDRAPAEVFATLLDDGDYLCSERTMYRILSEQGEVHERRQQRRRTEYTKPELLATGPNQVWSWDITKLKGPRSWNGFHLYVIIDIFSRYVVGWMVAERESAMLAERLISETALKQNVRPGALTIHADRGAAMRSKPVAQLLGDLGITKSHSRPYVSDDNPFSESQFKTLKYFPSFPGAFGSIEDARAFCRSFFHWYNNHHRHGGIAMLTPAVVHHGCAQSVLHARQSALRVAYHRNPHRFVRGCPRPEPLPEAVWINPPRPIGETIAQQQIATKSPEEVSQGC